MEMIKHNIEILLKQIPKSFEEGKLKPVKTKTPISIALVNYPISGRGKCVESFSTERDQNSTSSSWALSTKDFLKWLEK